MKLRDLVISSTVVAFVMWALAGIYHKVVAATFYGAETGAEHEGVVVIFLAYLVLGFLMTYLYRQLYKTGADWKSGLKFGAIIGLLWVFPHELAMAGAHGESIPYVFKNAVWHVAEQGIGGVVIAVVLSRLDQLN